MTLKVKVIQGHTGMVALGQRWHSGAKKVRMTLRGGGALRTEKWGINTQD